MIHHSLLKTIMMDDRHEEGRHTGTSDSMKFPRGLMCLSFRAAIPRRPLRMFRFIEEQTREVLGGLLFFDVTMMMTYRSGFKTR